MVRQYLTGDIETVVGRNVRRGMDNEIGHLLGRLHVLVMHGTDRLMILFQDLLDGPTTLLAIAIHTSNQSNVGRGVLEKERMREPNIKLPKTTTLTTTE